MGLAWNPKKPCNCDLILRHAGRASGADRQRRLVAAGAHFEPYIYIQPCVYGNKNQCSGKHGAAWACWMICDAGGCEM